MGTLIFKRVTQEVESTDFDCGVDSINQEIKESYYPTLTREANAFSISYEGVIIGYCAVVFNEVVYQSFPENISEYCAEWKENSITVVHIKYIAVGTQYQRRGLGTAILKTLIAKARIMACEWPIRVITMDARNELVGWYSKENFSKMCANPTQQEGVSTAMFIEFNPYNSELENYVEGCIY